MKYGIFSDVHGNQEAFGAVLRAMEEQKVDHYVFLGDIVGYGADAKACIRLLRDLIKRTGCICVGGNHDHAVCGLSSYEDYSRPARAAVEWTKKALNAQEMDFLRQLPLVQEVDGFCAVHAGMDSPEKWGYVFDIDDADRNFQAFTQPLCFIGHSHKPIIFTAADEVDWVVSDALQLKPGTRYIVNVGSVGQPRDSDPRACFAVYDSAAGTVHIRRVEYDIAAAQAKILQAGLPKILADRLALGK